MFASGSLEDEIPSGEVLKDKGESFVLRFRGKTGSIMNVISLLVGRTNYHCPVASEDLFQFHFDVLTGLVLIVSLCLSHLMNSVNHHILDVWCNFGPLNCSYLRLL